MVFNLPIDVDTIGPTKKSECNMLMRALDYYKINVAIENDDPAELFQLDALTHKLTVGLLATVERLSEEAREGRAV